MFAGYLCWWVAGCLICFGGFVVADFNGFCVPFICLLVVLGLFTLDLHFSVDFV